jgi:hypothetical protein
VASIPLKDRCRLMTALAEQDAFLALQNNRMDLVGRHLWLVVRSSSVAVSPSCSTR